MAAPEVASGFPIDPRLIPSPQAALNQAGAVSVPNVQEAFTASMDPLNAPGARAAAQKRAAADADAAQAKQSEEAQAAEQSRLESEHGQWATIGTQGARGLLDVLLAPGALLGAASEGIGDVVGSKAMSDFGRDLGRSASGRSAMEAGAFLFGGGGDEGLTESERALKNLDEQQKAWPMLSAVSHGAGMAGAALGLGAAGGFAEGATSAATNIGIGAAEGGAGGAQSAYEANAPLSDVLTSTLFGAAMGGGLAAAGEGASYLYGKLKNPAKNAAERIFDNVPERPSVTVDQAGGKEGQGVLSELTKIRNSVREAGEAVDNPVLKQEAMKEATEQGVDRLTKRAGNFDPTSWESKEPNALQKVVYRGPILDQVSGDLSQHVATTEALRPSMDFELAPARLPKLLKDADAPVAIGTVQQRVQTILQEMPTDAMAPDSKVFTSTLAGMLKSSQQKLSTAELPEAMAEAHSAVKTLLSAAENAPDDITRSYAQRSAKALIDDLSSEPFGAAGQAYRNLYTQPSQQMAALGDQAVLRDALRTTEIRGKLPALIKDNNSGIAAAYDARWKLAGEPQPKGLAQELRTLETRFSKAEDAVTLDGGPIGRVVDFFKDKVSDHVAHTIGAGTGAVLGGYPGAILGSVVAGTIKPALKGLVPIIKEAALGAVKGASYSLPTAARAAAPIASRLLTPEEKQDQYHERLDELARTNSSPDPRVVERGLKSVPNMSPALMSQVTTDYVTKTSQLLQDMPKPKPSIRGKAYETLSSDDVRKANAMWEATMKPLSIFEDFKRGNLDYDKVQYAWKQYPGLKQVAQAGLLDILTTQLNDTERSGIPDGILTQLDFLFAFGGALQNSIEAGFCQRMTALGAQQAEQNKPQPGGPLKLSTAEPTYTQRLMGQK